MEGTKAGLTGALQIMESTSIGTETRIQTAGLQTRKILEDMAYAALVSNKDAGDKTEEELKDLRYPKDIFKDIGKGHPNFFPTPVEIRDPSKGKPFVIKAKGVMTKGKLPQIYRELNPLAHSTNPMAEPVDLQYFEEKIPVWLEEIVNTLDTHQVMLLHHPDHFYIVKMKGDRDGSVQCTPFTKDATGHVHMPLAGLCFRCQQAILRVLGQTLARMHPAGEGTRPDARKDAQGDGRRGR